MNYRELPPDDVQELLSGDPEYVSIDVRTVQEFEQGHVPGSYNIPIFFMTSLGMQPNPEFLAAVTRRFPKEQKIVFVCKSGGRSARACETLGREGYRSLVNLAGGFHGLVDMSGGVVQQGWADCGLDTARVCEPGRSWADLSKV